MTTRTPIPTGRVWSLRFHMGTKEKWVITLGLSQPSLLAANSQIVLLIEAHGRKPGCATPHRGLTYSYKKLINLEPKG